VNQVHPPRGQFHDRRATIQFAADAEWPFTNPANAASGANFSCP
jgi:hypothetical protein